MNMIPIPSGMIAHKVALFLPQDTIDHLDRIAYALAKKNGHQPNRSEAVVFLTQKHWREWMIKRHDKATQGGLVLPA